MPSNKKHKITIPIIVAIIGGICAIIAAIIAAIIGILPDIPQNNDQPFGEILTPQDSVMVNESIDVTGTLENIPQDHYIWLAVQKGNHLWPKEAQISTTMKKWQVRIYEGGLNQKFSLVLLMVKENGNKFIKSWIDTCKVNNDWSGMALTEIPELTILDIVEGLQN